MKKDSEDIWHVVSYIRELFTSLVQILLLNSAVVEYRIRLVAMIIAHHIDDWTK